MWAATPAILVLKALFSIVYFFGSILRINVSCRYSFSKFFEKEERARGANVPKFFYVA